jgi:hypothetical protein
MDGERKVVPIGEEFGFRSQRQAESELGLPEILQA